MTSPAPAASTGRKRNRTAEPAEDNQAECPFSVQVVDPSDKENKKKKKRRRTENGEEAPAPEDVANKIHLQMSPFAPCGKFKTHETMDLYYKVTPAKEWMDMTRYNSFVLNGVKYFSEGFIYVANDSSIQRQKSKPAQPRKKSDDDWVARILEIRASDEHHVYARVHWMYWPDELPSGTHDGKKVVSSRQPYHGLNELIASNHMDIINVVSVTSQATVKQWYEENDEEIQNALYWRQAFDVRTYELSSVDLVCSCNTPANPDKQLLGCTSEDCKKWMHEQCVIDDALRSVWNRLGDNKPHLPPEPTKKEDDDEKEGQRPLSPTETGGTAAETQQSINVDVQSNGQALNGNGNVNVKPEDEDAAVAPEESTQEPSSSRRSASEKTATGTPQIKLVLKSSSTARKTAKVSKKKTEANGENARPWEGKFEVHLNTTQSGPPTLEFKDLREGIVGGAKAWTEPVKCLLCHATAT
ncbi:hypothetical protein QBC35DRAFT_202133 [Podospora australis]|uniref:BAH domain-containing protein n=1 Tax=Podospora australis TaxID=1536484 RepID=A0AAN6X3U4_9PEZI|nr:hypothetical protein QBC35DRAFT_202133 [Podospora australis]